VLAEGRLANFHDAKLDDADLRSAKLPATCRCNSPC
jgi:hypothetical protein